MGKSHQSTNFINVITPWGKSHGGCLLAPGIKLYHTPSHGGIKVYKKLNEQIPLVFRNQSGWYEEDCESKIPFYFHYEMIRNHCLLHGMAGWPVTAEEYFAKYTRLWFQQGLERWYPAACAIYFGKEYSHEELAARYMSRDVLEQEKERLLRKTAHPPVRRGDRVVFDTPIRFSNGMEYCEFIFESRSNFTTAYGIPARISNWKQRSYRIAGNENLLL